MRAKRKKITDKMRLDWMSKNGAELCQDLAKNCFVLFYGIFRIEGKDPKALIDAEILSHGRGR